MVDWTDPVTYAALAGAAGTVLSVFQYLDRRTEKRGRREAETKPLVFDIEDWNAVMVHREDRVVEVTIRVINPATANNVLREARLRVAFGNDAREFATTNPESRTGTVDFPDYGTRQGPWILGNLLVKADAISLPVNVPAGESRRGRLYFALAEEFGGPGAFSDRSPAVVRVVFTDIRDAEYEVDLR